MPSLRTFPDAPCPRSHHGVGRRAWRHWWVAIALLSVVSGCGLDGEDVEALRQAARPYLDDSPTSVAPPASLPEPNEARTMLTGLADSVRRDASLPAYARAAFGTAWRDVDDNGCNQRDDVLLRDALPGSLRTATQGRCDHDVLGGTWHDPYTGTVLELDDLKNRSQAQKIQIDHVVPLAEAWRSGASRWSDERRERFANDLDVLLAVDGPTNASKGDGDPASWRPRSAHQCTYAVRWIVIKDAWALSVDRSERRALTEMLGTCPDE